MDKLKSIYASAYSATVTVAVIAAVTIGAELSADFKTWLAGFTGHHWITKSLLTLIVFGVFYGLFRLLGKSASEIRTQRALIMLQAFIILGFLVILGFYIYEFFFH